MTFGVCCKAFSVREVAVQVRTSVAAAIALKLKLELMVGPVRGSTM